jgi:hypothetical protein
MRLSRKGAPPPPLRSACGSARTTQATTPPSRQRATPTTCSPTGSAAALTAPCNAPSACPSPATRPASPGSHPPSSAPLGSPRSPRPGSTLPATPPRSRSTPPAHRRAHSARPTTGYELLASPAPGRRRNPDGMFGRPRRASLSRFGGKATTRCRGGRRSSPPQLDDRAVWARRGCSGSAFRFRRAFASSCRSARSCCRVWRTCCLISGRAKKRPRVVCATW